MLLQWCTLEPSEKGGLAAIRFSSPVRVQSIRIFPLGAKPFAQCPDTVSRTEPEAFFLDVYFNAQPITTPDAKERPKHSNALVPTSIAYAGGQRDFAVDMGSEHATRLMIVKGEFEAVSLAIYGEVVTEALATPSTYAPRPLPSITPAGLPPALDPANTRDPTQLARQLLKLIPNAPDLELVIRLIFCLKPSNEDWDLPDFPYLHPDLDDLDADAELEKVVKLTTRPVPDDISSEHVARFTEKVAQCVNPKDLNQAYHVASILYNAASQHPSLAQKLLDAIELEKVFDSSTIDDETTMLRLLHAASNVDIARKLGASWFRDLLTPFTSELNADRDMRTNAKRLLARTQGWTVLEDAFSNTQGDYIAAADMLKDIAVEEQSFGIWLESAIAHGNVASSLAENPVLSVALPRLFSHRPTDASPSQDEFVAFVRAYIGVACVLAVYAWSDSLPDERCRARVLGILRLWQGVDGYREIVNHLLLLRQMTFRLECMTDLDLPTQSGIDAEHILVDLAKTPAAILRPNFLKCILNIGTATLFITDEERSSMRQAAFVVDDGFGGAVDELMGPVDRPPTFGSLRTIRVALAMMNRELDEDDEAHVLDDFWEEAKCSLTTCLSDLLAPVVEEIRNQFSLSQRPPPHMGQDVVAQLFWAADDILRTFLRLVSTHPLPSRMLRALATNVADVFACTDAADMRYSQSGQPSLAAQETRQSCIDLIRALGSQPPVASGAKPGAQIVLRDLLEHGLHSNGLDPTHHLLQVFCLIDFLLPSEDCADGQRSLWVQTVFPTVLKELWTFCHALDTENKVHFIRRLSALDQEVIGVGEWLLLEEVKDVSRAVQTLQDGDLSDPKRRIVQNQISLFFRFFSDLLQSSSGRWCVDSLAATEEAPHLLASALYTMFDLHLVPPYLGEVLDTLAAGYDVFDNELRWAMVIGLWRSLQTPDVSSSRLEGRIGSSVKVVATITPSYLEPLKLTAEVGWLVQRLSQYSDTVDENVAQSVVSLFEWLSQSAVSIPKMADLHTIASDQFGTFRDRLKDALSGEWKERLDAACCQLVPGAANVAPQDPTGLPESADLSIHDIEELLRQTIPVPSTPPRRPLNQDVLGLVTVSPAALLRSPAVTGLTKTYLNNDFRQLRQSSARANTSRLPSMHVDVGVALAA
ncbi:uncharacterized protein TRAVEDRAFT_117295 [Trametes versicolor FP-101664 SS1]|uniref:uncharacterized protein n=1 Tax=Trametes versicolor (strain FP-101664) TaxID=717944 RepID=UPI0004622DDE|nr:uncharacterized protein TRAVEDRAFT_117295 [Trametes versicolor FP-101664 SS1]EIW61349.1 hypothetical protein TRAVEDRAFT_117295 [Trametes versicolor FP-101664 SS1]